MKLHNTDTSIQSISISPIYRHDVESCTGRGIGIVRIRSFEVDFLYTKWTSHFVTVEEIDGNWRVYRWTDEGFTCYSRSIQNVSGKFHICSEAPGLFSLTDVYQACLKVSEGKKYGVRNFSCNKWSQEVMKCLTGLEGYKARAWSKCRLQEPRFKSCSNLNIDVQEIQPQD